MAIWHQKLAFTKKMYLDEEDVGWGYTTHFELENVWYSLNVTCYHE